MAQGKVMIIGLDAATLELVRPWAAEGRLPNFARFLSEGSAGPLLSTIPVMSPAAWSTFATGTNPGKHGILDFSQLGPESYQTSFNNASRRRGETFWEVAGRQGVRGGVINVPITYPPREYNGFMISGTLSPGVGPRMAWPPEVFDDLMAVCPDYEIDVDMVATGRVASDEFFRKTLRMTELRLRAALGLYRKHRPPLFCVAFVGADRASHYFWGYMSAAEAGEPLGAVERRLAGAIRTVYEKLDAVLGELLAAADDETDVLVMSDHGAGPLRRGLNLRKALAAAGLLVESTPGLWERAKHRAIWAFARLAPLSLKNRIKSRFAALASRAASVVACRGIDFARSRAYPTGQSQGVFVNLRGRQPQGIVAPEDYEAVRDEIIAVLSELSDPQTHRRVAKKVHRREELWTGPRVESLPDVVMEQADYSYDIPTFSQHTGEGVFYELPALDASGLQRRGGHMREGLLMAMGPHIRRAEIAEAEIADVPATVLALLGCDIPDDFDGRVLTEMLTDDVAAPGTIASWRDDGPGGEVYSDEDQAAIEQRLRGLGYL